MGPCCCFLLLLLLPPLLLLLLPPLLLLLLLMRGVALYTRTTVVDCGSVLVFKVIPKMYRHESGFRAASRKFSSVGSRGRIHESDPRVSEKALAGKGRWTRDMTRISRIDMTRPVWFLDFQI